MSARKRRSPTDPAVDGISEPKRVDVFDLADTTCSYTGGSNNLLFDPNRVLLRLVFFLDPEKTKYISVGYYPPRNYQLMLEIGSSKVNPILLTEQHVKTLGEYLPAHVDALWKGVATTYWMVNLQCTLLHPTSQLY
jgi:hypothetical protein